METPQNDVKPPEADPSPAPNDVTPAPSAEGVTPAPPAEPAAKPPVSTDEIVDSVFKKHEVTESAPVEKPEKPAPDKPAKEPAAKEEPGKTQAEKPKDQDVPVEFAKHPAWKRIIGERDAARAESAAVKKSADIYEGNKRWMQENKIAPEEHVSVMTAYAECRKAGVEPQHLNELLQWRKLAETDPAKALEMGRQALQFIAERSGQALPADLQEKVDAGEITEALAKAYQAERIKANRASQLETTHSQTQAAHAQQLVESAVGNWITQKQTANPSYRPAENGQTGIWEVVDAFVNRLASEKISQVKRALNPQEMVEICEKAYSQATGFTGRNDPKRPERRAPFNGSSKNNADAKTSFDDNDSIIDAAAALQAERA